MNQNIIAIIWDFDKTLIDGYMQEPIFDTYGVDPKDFWNEVNEMQGYYEDRGIKVNRDTSYLNHFITCTHQGIFEGLNNEKLRAFGQQLKFYPGVPEIFTNLEKVVLENPKYQEFGIQVEHYIVSTGMSEVIRGSVVYDYVKTLWGCEFIEAPYRSKINGHGDEAVFNENIITQVGYTIDNTSKTRAIFEINKGSNIYKEIDVNSKLEASDRRVPIDQMIYVADGPSDVPAFSVIKLNGGRNFAIYPQGDYKAFRQVNKLISDGRIDMFAEADYREGTTTFMWLKEQIQDIADKIFERNKAAISKSVSKAPEHLE